MRDVRLTYKGNEITSTWGRALAVSVLAISVPLLLLITALSLPLHVALRALGRQGFYYNECGEGYYHVSTQGFTRA